MDRIYNDITYTPQRQILNILLAYTVLGPIKETGNLPTIKVFLEFLYLEGNRENLKFSNTSKNIVRF